MAQLVRTNDNCIGCNKCSGVCSCPGANIATEVNGKNHIVVDETRCIGCGACIDACVHGAREFVDDTERFFNDLKYRLLPHRRNDRLLRQPRQESLPDAA